jgi:hypothetical protein
MVELEAAFWVEEVWRWCASYPMVRHLDWTASLSSSGHVGIL